MGRRRGVVSALNQMARIAAREARRAEKEARRQRVAFERAERVRARAHKAAAKEARAQYLESRREEVEELNAQLEEELGTLAGILEATLKVDDTISFDSLKLDAAFPAFVSPAPLARAAHRPVEGDFVGAVRTPGFLLWIGFLARKHEKRLVAARSNYLDALRTWEKGERERLDALHAAQVEHEKHAAAHAEKVAQRSAEVERFRDEYRAGNADAIVAYYSMVLERSTYPDSIETDFELSYSEDAGELTVEYDLPKKDCVPAVEEYKFVKARDEIEEKVRKATQLRAVYQDVIAGICLRSIHEVLEADQHKHLRSVVFNGFVSDVNPATGQDSEHGKRARAARSV